VALGLGMGPAPAASAPSWALRRPGERMWETLLRQSEQRRSLAGRGRRTFAAGDMGEGEKGRGRSSKKRRRRMRTEMVARRRPGGADTGTSGTVREPMGRPSEAGSSREGGQCCVWVSSCTRQSLKTAHRVLGEHRRTSMGIGRRTLLAPGTEASGEAPPGQPSRGSAFSSTEWNHTAGRGLSRCSSNPRGRWNKVCTWSTS